MPPEQHQDDVDTHLSPPACKVSSRATPIRNTIAMIAMSSFLHPVRRVVWLGVAFNRQLACAAQTMRFDGT